MTHTFDDNNDIPPITRPFTADEILTKALTVLNEIETVLIHLPDPSIREKVSTIMRDHADDLSGYGGLIDWVQLTAKMIQDHLNNQ